MLFLSVDVEKAIDQAFMVAVLLNLGLGQNYLKWIKDIYSCPTAQVKKNDILSKSSTLHGGTRQA